MKIFVGNDNFESLLNARKFLKDNFPIEKFDVSVIEGDQIDNLENFIGDIEASDLFGKERVIFLKRIEKNKEILEFLSNNLEVYSKKNIVIWTDGIWDKRTKVIKNFYKEDIMVEYNDINPKEYIYWIEKISRSLNLQMNKIQFEKLFEKWGDNKWGIYTDLKKYSLIKCFNLNVTFEKVIEDAYQKPKEIWSLLDAFGKKDYKLFIKELKKINSKSEFTQLLITMLSREIKNYTLIKIFEKKGLEMSELKLHPFVLKKSRSNSKLFEISELKNMLIEIMTIDIQSRNGSGHFNSQISLLAVKHFIR